MSKPHLSGTHIFLIAFDGPESSDNAIGLCAEAIRQAGYKVEGDSV